MSSVLNNQVPLELTDAELVRRAIGGDTGAFDLLVLRHRANVLYAARSAVRDWEQAEDVAQQALVEAYKSLRGLRDGTSLKAWLMTITRRCASRYREREALQPDAIELSEAMICSFVPPVAYPGIDAVTERVRASLSELSARSRQVVTLHYLDGYSCKEIGGRLGIPAGTVKRILHESRNNLRSTMGIAKGDVRQMEVIDKAKRKTGGPRRLSCWGSGEYPGVINNLLEQSIALTINKQPMTAAEIGNAIGVHIGFVEEALEPLVREELVMKDGRKYITSFIALDAEDSIQITREIQSCAAGLADALEKHLPELRQAWEETSFPAQGFAWADSMWPVLGKLVLMYGVDRQYPPQPQAPVHAGSGKAYWVAGQERATGERDQPILSWAISQAPVSDHVFWYGYITATYLNKPDVEFMDRERGGKVAGAIAWGATEIESIADYAKLSIEQTREIVARAIEVGHVELQDGKLKLPFPVIDRKENDQLFPTVDAVALRLYHEVIGLAAASMADQFGSLGYGRVEEQIPVWRGFMISNIVAESLRHLLRRGVVPDLEQGPAHCHMLGFKDQLPIMMNSYPE